MLNDLAAPQPAGFGRCSRCAFWETGPIATCYNCASTAISPPSDTRCRVCDQRLRQLTSRVLTPSATRRNATSSRSMPSR